jgi:hypothetical protein
LTALNRGSIFINAYGSSYSLSALSPKNKSTKQKPIDKENLFKNIFHAGKA